MAIYHVMALPKPGTDPDPRTRPLAPRDITADSDADAFERTRSLINQEAGEWSEYIGETKGEEAAAEFDAEMEQWQPVVQRVDRPAVDVERRSWTSEMVKDGVVVGTRYHHGEDTCEQSFDVLVDGIVSGLLQQGHDGWHLIKATGRLAHLDGRQWVDDRGPGLAWPDAPLAEIRSALERVH